MNSANNPFAAKSISDVLSDLKVDPEAGLSDGDVKERQAQGGLNEVPQVKKSMVIVFLKHFWGLTAFMLEFTILVSFLLKKYMDVYLIGGLMVFNAVISFIQERRAAKTVAALKGSLQVTVRVLRDKKWVETTGNQVVPGDIIRLRTGDLITADAKLLNGVTEADESVLTGESKLNHKKAGNILYAGSILKSGECSAIIIATGTKTFFGKTAQLVQKAEPRLHMDDVVTDVVKILISIVLVFLTITISISLLRGEAFLSILPLLLILLISAVPVALPAMFTVSMAKGSQQLAAEGVLVSRLSATEDAATMTTLCIDKTGTLTENKVAVQEIIPAKNFTVNEVIQYAVLASVTANNDPIDMAFIEKANLQKLNLKTFKQVSFVPFTAAAKRTEAVVQQDDKQFTVLKGAYNTLKELCKVSDAELDKTVKSWADMGFKTLAVAVKRDNIITIAGVAALIDPPLADSKEMIAQIIALGVKVKMLTGDALPIAREIAIQVGIGSDIVSAGVLRTNPDEDAVRKVIIMHNGFAEVLPEDKFDIVKTLQQHREITGMTGDGVNDAPALKQAEVGIAVKSATDVAKQAASVILLEEGLNGIISLIAVGRTIHHRITNWVVSKISKTLFTVIFVCTAYMITGQFIVDALGMIVLLFVLDFVELTLSTDNVNWSRSPENWVLKPLAKKGFILGLLCTAEALIWLFIGKKYLAISHEDQLHSFGFAILFFTGIFNLIIVRTQTRFYMQPIGKILLSAIIADVVFVIFILTVHIPGFTSLSIFVTASSLVYIMFCGLFINDWLKTLIV